MRPRAAKIEAPERHAVIGVTEHRPVREELVEPHLAVEDVAADQAEAALEIERRQRQPADDAGGEARRVAVDMADDGVGRLLAPRVPAPRDLEGEMLAEQAGDMGAGRSEAVVEG